MTTTSNTSFEERVKKYTMWDHEDPEHEDYEEPVECCLCCETEDLRVAEEHCGGEVHVCKDCYEEDQDNGNVFQLLGDDWSEDEDEDEDEDENKNK